MARMVPSVDAPTITHSSEAQVYEALKDQLSDDFTVIHSYPWLRPWREQDSLAEGETDFVILHRQYGILVLEVKGGDGIRYDGKNWFRESSGGPKRFQDPFEQARRNMHALIDIVEERSEGTLTKHDFVYGYAVAFPHVDYEESPPSHADRAIIISRRHLASMEGAIRTAFKAWGGSRNELRREQYETLLNECLMPKFRMIRRIGPEIASVAERLLELTEQQAQVFEGLYTQNRVVVEGVAGSGKTFLALHRALAFARTGQRTLFVCYNSALAHVIRRQVADDASTKELRSSLTIRNFHALAKELGERAGVDFKPVHGGLRTSHFWDEGAADLLEQSVWILEGRGENIRYDALVIDEAQDFAWTWWYALTQSLLRDSDGPLYAFMDPNQSLRRKIQMPPVDFNATFRLTTNCRNTRRIAVASAAVLGLQCRLFARAPVGPAIVMRYARSPDDQKRLVCKEARRLLAIAGVKPNQLVLISPSSKSKGSVANVREINGVPLTTSMDSWHDGTGVLVTTSRSFKGLEADVVLLYDLGEFGSLFERKDLYVACTRARSLLIAIIHGQDCRAVLETSQTASERQT